MYTFHPNFDIIEFSARSNCYYTHKCTKYCSYDDGMSVRLKRNWHGGNDGSGMRCGYCFGC